MLSFWWIHNMSSHVLAKLCLSIYYNLILAVLRAVDTINVFYDKVVFGQVFLRTFIVFTVKKLGQRKLWPTMTEYNSILFSIKLWTRINQSEATPIKLGSNLDSVNEKLCQRKLWPSFSYQNLIMSTQNLFWWNQVIIY